MQSTRKKLRIYACEFMKPKRHDFQILPSIFGASFSVPRLAQPFPSATDFGGIEKDAAEAVALHACMVRTLLSRLPLYHSCVEGFDFGFTKY
jgi:hypothetical protein